MQRGRVSLPRIKTGDLVLFSGTCRISTLIKGVTCSHWSHVGMVLRLDAWEFPLLWESTPNGRLPDVECGEIVSGVQLVPLQERIERFEGGVALRVLEEEPTPDMLRALALLRKEVRGRAYETCRQELLLAAYDGPFGVNQPNLDSLFCSELVALAYQRMGYLDASHPPNEFTPKDFSDSGNLSLMRGSLSGELTIKGCFQEFRSAFSTAGNSLFDN